MRINRLVVFIVILLLHSCDRNKNLNDEEYKIVNEVIKKSIKPSLDKMMLSNDLEVYKKNRSYEQLIRVADSLMNKRTYIFSISETLSAVDTDDPRHSSIFDYFLFKKLSQKRYSAPLKLNFNKIKFNENTKKGFIKDSIKINYIGHYELSRAIFSEDQNKAIIELKETPAQALFRGNKVILLEKRKNKWNIKQIL